MSKIEINNNTQGFTNNIIHSLLRDKYDEFS